MFCCGTTKNTAARHSMRTGSPTPRWILCVRDILRTREVAALTSPMGLAVEFVIELDLRRGEMISR
jgi:hypothetical protein